MMENVTFRCIALKELMRAIVDKEVEQHSMVARSQVVSTGSTPMLVKTVPVIKAASAPGNSVHTLMMANATSRHTAPSVPMAATVISPLLVAVGAGP